MSIHLASMFYYKLCAEVRGKLYPVTHRTQDLSLCAHISQSLTPSEEPIYVYVTPALAITEEQESESFTLKSHKKTIIKLHCSGSFIGNSEKRAYSSMTVVEDIGYPDQFRSTISSKSNTRRVSPQVRTKLNPSILTPMRIYLSPHNHPSPFRYQSNPKKMTQNLNPKPLSTLKLGKNLFCKIPNEKEKTILQTIYKKYQKIQKETQWLMSEVSYLESLHKYDKLERTDSRFYNNLSD